MAEIAAAMADSVAGRHRYGLSEADVVFSNESAQFRNFSDISGDISASKIGCGGCSGGWCWVSVPTRFLTRRSATKEGSPLFRSKKLDSEELGLERRSPDGERRSPGNDKEHAASDEEGSVLSPDFLSLNFFLFSVSFL